MEKFLRLFCLFLFAFGILLSLSGNNGKIVVWFHNGNNMVLHINEMPEFQYTNDSIVFYNGNTTHKWPLEIVQKLTFEDVEPVFWSVDALSSDDDTGTVTGSGLIEDGESVSLTAVPSEGYIFDCWSDGTTDNPYTFTPTSNVELTALFLPGKYTMNFVLDIGEENVVITQEYKTPLTAPEDPVKTGFTFKAWSPAVPATIPASDMTFTAQWERNKYLVTFVAEDTVAKKDSVLYEGTITKPAVPVKEGYTFTSWQPEVPETMPANDLTFNAQFKINTYSVIYMVKGEEWARDSLDYGATIVKREYTAVESETFNDWLSNADYLTMPAHDVVYTADITSGISTILASKSEVDVYTILGRLVARRLPVAQIHKILPRGAYIIEDVKVVIR